MRKISTTLILAIIALAASSQKFTIQPQVGVENSVTKMSYNGSAEFKPLRSLITPTVGLRMDYTVKGHGIYFGVSSTNPVVAYSFSDASTGMTSYTAKAGQPKVQFQGGYQLATKKISLNCPSASSKSSSAKSCGSKPAAAKSCGGYVRSHCGGDRSKSMARSKRNIPYMQFIPSIGVAYKPFNAPAFESTNQGNQKVYTYNAGTSKTSLNAGMAVEFGVGNRKSFSLSLNYIKGLGENEEKFNSVPDATKPMQTTTLKSSTSGFNATLGFPLTFNTAKKHHKTSAQKRTSGCSKQIRSCGR